MCVICLRVAWFMCSRSQRLHWNDRELQLRNIRASWVQVPCPGEAAHEMPNQCLKNLKTSAHSSLLPSRPTSSVYERLKRRCPNAAQVNLPASAKHCVSRMPSILRCTTCRCSTLGQMASSAETSPPVQLIVDLANDSAAANSTKAAVSHRLQSCNKDCPADVTASASKVSRSACVNCLCEQNQPHMLSPRMT